jgi:RNA polymerase sigma-70 factor (ECF subfamily)
MTVAGEESDEHLMARLREGDESALNALMGRWQVPLRRFLYRFLQSDAQALDVAEETFVRIYSSRNRYSEAQPFRPWVFAIATNLARNQLRWRRRHPGESLDGSSGPYLAREDALLENATPADQLGRAERAAAVRDAIARLPEDLRTAVLLFEYEDLPQAEIAVIMGCSAKAVETRLYRARGLLKKALERFMAGA